MCVYVDIYDKPCRYILLRIIWKQTKLNDLWYMGVF